MKNSVRQSVMADKRAKRGSMLVVLKKLLTKLGARRAALALSMLLALVSAVLKLFIPVLVGRAIDCIAGQGAVDLDGLLASLLKMGLCALGAALSEYAMSLVNNRVVYFAVRKLREEAFARLQQQPLAALDRRSVGDTVNRLVNDADRLADGLLAGVSQLFTGVVTIAGTLVFMLKTQPVVALAVVLLSPLSLLVASFIARRSYESFALRSAAQGEASAIVEELTSEQKLIRAFSAEKAAKARFEAANEKLEMHSLRAVFLSSLTNPATRFVNSTIYAAVAVIGGFAVIGGSLSVGSLTALLAYANQYTKPFNEISGVFAELQGALACAQRLFELIEAPVQDPDPEAPICPAQEDNSLDFRAVAFSYSKDRELIRDFSLKVKNGSRVAIVGPTGCGKTTLINLIMRFYDVDSGEILLGGVETRSMTRGELRSRFGMVLQETFIMSGTVRENIALGNKNATLDEVMDAAKQAHAHAFIMRLKNGYDTPLSDGGAGLSEGQKQLISIARVMLMRPNALILDEATSSIDVRTELLVQDAFARLMRGRTSFVVAHRLSTVKNADVILVMKDGAIIEQGDHSSLLALGGFYRTLYDNAFAHDNA